MYRRLLLAALACVTVISAADVNAQTTPRAATVTKPAVPASDLGWLGAPDREDPSPAITSLKGVGTSNAVAEARMTQKVLTEYCAQKAQLYPSAPACVKQKQSEYANRIFRASAD